MLNSSRSLIELLYFLSFLSSWKSANKTFTTKQIKVFFLQVDETTTLDRIINCKREDWISLLFQSHRLLKHFHFISSIHSNWVLLSVSDAWNSLKNETVLNLYTIHHRHPQTPKDTVHKETNHSEPEETKRKTENKTKEEKLFNVCKCVSVCT